jgi:hypothetical protein
VAIHDHDRVCSFCGSRGSKDRPLVSGLGAMICVPCVEDFHALAVPVSAGTIERTPQESMSDDELLATLPLIMRTAQQVDEVAAERIGAARERGVSWAAIGQALGVSRQAAWERFSKRTTPRSTG